MHKRKGIRRDAVTVGSLTRHASSSRRRALPPSSNTIAGVTITHPDRLVYEALGLTKLDVVRYYDTVAERMVRHLADRPLTLVQCAPDTEHCRYLRHSHQRAPEQVRVVRIQEQTKVGDYMVVDDRMGLIALAQRNILELHTWNTTTAEIEQPNRVVLDLDPGPDVPWKHMVEAAHLLRDVLHHVELESWLKTTGGAGLHVVIPIRQEHDWSTCLGFAKAVAVSLVQHDSSRYTTTFAKRGRERQILIDYLRNNRTNTSVSAYSLRARPGAPVSMPMHWDELTTRMQPQRWTIRTVPRRLQDLDPWASYFRKRQRLAVALVQVEEPLKRGVRRS
jgi:bifunctional non-homologous end joining protein LigD